VNGWMGYILKEKLKRLKGVLKKWNKEVYGSVDNKIEALVCELEVLDLKGESEGLLQSEAIERKSKFEHLWLLLKSKDSLEF
ncbi:RNA-directed DNA polymerase (Reverse transcriptase), partial [Trifolium medium]|nr:RNA-directed DNA polymerase (Reverse transcriptase) [Trifolium medium]